MFTFIVLGRNKKSFRICSDIFSKWLECYKSQNLNYTNLCVGLVAQSCLILWDCMDCSPPAPPFMGILQARILEWVAMPSSRGSSQPRDQTQVSHIAGRFFTVWATREAFVSMLLSIHPTPSFPYCAHKFVLYVYIPFMSASPLCLHPLCCPANRFISTIFLDSIHMH